MSLIRETQLAPTFSGAPVPLDRPARYGDGPVVRARAKQRTEPDTADAPATKADVLRVEEMLTAILATVEDLRERLDKP